MFYGKLRGKIREKYGTQSKFAKAMEMNPATLSAKLCGLVDWRRSEMVRACILLDISPCEIYDYFFEEKVA